ncbi:protoporphyrinogen oxidase [Actinophytocola gossypii]|uniref:Coproporphyrinogen III oxidase n=1 Tax=Actinophytocola gossypii TaxID=2812003 RepID=A0ABT2JH06_9PSEU|nr:protoporphyrinogen oxidase [Actinophytocola gossypii]MCT2587167.1 protoporphyrinogen oxidase [Actinophytocola gossypii]
MSNEFDVLVVGGGITGLTVAQQLTARSPRTSVAVLEAGDRTGGIVGSYRREGFTVDTGPHGFVVYGPGGVSDLATELGLADELMAAEPAAQRLFLLRDDHVLEPMPTSVTSFLRSALLSPMGKLRAAAEIVMPRRLAEEPFFHFTARRFGVEVARALAVPAVLGVTGGDSKNLSVDAKFPFIRYLEKEYRSILVGALRTTWQQQRAAGKRILTLPKFEEFGMRLFSFRGQGMQRLVDALEKSVAEHVRLGARVSALDRDGDGWRATLTSGEPVRAAQVVLALPAYAAAALLGPHLPRFAATLTEIPHPDVRVVGIGYREADLARQPDGIGFLTIPTEHTHILGTIHTSTIFPDQAPPGTVLIRTLAGGVQDRGFAELSSVDAVETVHQDLRRVFGVRGRPVFSFDHLWRRAIPEYQVGHRNRIDAGLAEVARLGGVHLAGNTYHGVGINDCVRDARRVADDLVGTPVTVSS